MGKRKILMVSLVVLFLSIAAGGVSAGARGSHESRTTVFDLASNGTAEGMETDPWEPFNSRMFSFNRNLDQHIFKPIARTWDFVVPDPVQHGLRNGVDNLDVGTRLVNSLLQGKFGAGQEAARFLINSTVGIGGMFDVAKNQFNIDKSDEDTGQTLGFYGVHTGPYLVLPSLPPTDVRDGIGTIIDQGLNPLSYLIGFAAQAGGATTGIMSGVHVTDAANRRSLNLERYDGVEETVIDLYSAVRDAYLQQREAKVKK